MCCLGHGGGCGVPAWHQKRLNTLTPFSETSPERLRLINKANSSAEESFVIHNNMESGADTDECFALVRRGVCLMLLLP